jgi:hypothetical protein
MYRPLQQELMVAHEVAVIRHKGHNGRFGQRQRSDTPLWHRIGSSGPGKNNGRYSGDYSANSAIASITAMVNKTRMATRPRTLRPSIQRRMALLHTGRAPPDL